MILSDQLNVRQYSLPDCWTLGPMKTQAQEIEASGGIPARSRVTPQRKAGTPAPLVTPNTLHPLLSDLVRY